MFSSKIKSTPLLGSRSSQCGSRRGARAAPCAQGAAVCLRQVGVVEPLSSCRCRRFKAGQPQAGRTSRADRFRGSRQRPGAAGPVAKPCCGCGPTGDWRLTFSSAHGFGNNGVPRSYRASCTGRAAPTCAARRCHRLHNVYASVACQTEEPSSIGTQFISLALSFGVAIGQYGKMAFLFYSFLG